MSAASSVARAALGAHQESLVGLGGRQRHEGTLWGAQVLETRTEAPEIVGSLSTLSQFYTENTPAARRQLRSTIENEGVKINEEFLAAAESVIKVGGLCWWWPWPPGWVQAGQASGLDSFSAALSKDTTTPAPR